MRTRLSKVERKNDILAKARKLIAARGLSGTEMEDIRLACSISRGGLYHHFANKRAILHALVEAEVAQLAEMLEAEDGSPIAALFHAGSSHLGNDPGVLAALSTDEEKLDYLSALDQAFLTGLRDVLEAKLRDALRSDVDAGHVSELFLVVNAHLNRREILGHWSSFEAAGFAATTLKAMAPLLKDPSELEPIISMLKRDIEGS